MAEQQKTPLQYCRLYAPLMEDISCGYTRSPHHSIRTLEEVSDLAQRIVDFLNSLPAEDWQGFMVEVLEGWQVATAIRQQASSCGDGGEDEDHDYYGVRKGRPHYTTD